MREADVGISVDTAVDIKPGIRQHHFCSKRPDGAGGRRDRRAAKHMPISSNIFKMTASSNFGNMFSVLAAKRVPALPPHDQWQILLLNLIYDVSCLAIPWIWMRITSGFHGNGRVLHQQILWYGSARQARFLILRTPSCDVFPDLPNGIRRAYHTLGEAGQEAYRIVPRGLVCGIAGEPQTLVIHMIRTPHILLWSRAAHPGSLLPLTTTASQSERLSPIRPSAALALLPMPAVYSAAAYHARVVYAACNPVQNKFVRRLWRTALLANRSPHSAVHNHQ